MKYWKVLTCLLIALTSSACQHEISEVVATETQTPSPTQTPHIIPTATKAPDYDPMEEPFLPENPTDLQLAEKLFWDLCMVCHGDVGQGLTDEFIALWPEEHQNCWSRGCHTNNASAQGFPIPREVPALVRTDKLGHFKTMQDMQNYLKATHPSKSPGIWEDHEYELLAYFVFYLNGRPLNEFTP